MRDDLPTLEALYARLENPERPRLDEVMAVPEPPHGAPYGLRGQRWMAEFDQRLARAADRWEAMISRGILPEAWADDPRRRFAGERCVKIDRANGTMTFAPVLDLPHPGSVDDVLTFACDAQGMLACEELARVLAQRLAPWSNTPFSKNVVWRTLSPVSARASWLWFLATPRTVVERVLVKAGQPDWAQHLNPTPTADDYAQESPVVGWRCTVRSVRAGVMAWREASALDLKVPVKVANTVVPREMAGRRFADLADPFRPMLDIFARGYFCDDLYTSIALSAQQL